MTDEIPSHIKIISELNDRIKELEKGIDSVIIYNNKFTKFHGINLDTLAKLAKIRTGKDLKPKN